MNRLAFLIVLGGLSWGCSSNSTVIVNENYAKSDFSKNKVLLLPISPEVLTILNKDDVEDDFGVEKSRAEAVIADSSYGVMMNAMRRSLQDVIVADSSSPP